MSRIRENPERLFEVFAEIAKPTDPSQDPFVLQKFPDDYDDQEILTSIPKFAFPCDSEANAVDHFTFVQTDIESKFKFGFCRHGMGAQTCLCIVSCLPWYEIFYKLLNELAEILNRTEHNHAGQLLQVLYDHEVPPASEEVDVVTPNLKERFTFVVPDPLQLPRIPDNRNLTEYYNAVDHSNMMILFAAMLYERRILITSKKLSRLTACIHGASSLLYPMHCAPMPFLIGVHSSLMHLVNTKQELGDAVVLDADSNTITTEYDDLGQLPSDVVSSMKKKLRSLQSDKVKGPIGDGVARVFLKTLVSLIGGYRDALKFRAGEQITFDSEAFVQSRHASMQPFLESMLQLQIFEQFINDRLDLLNAGLGFTDEFEVEANMLADKTGSQSKYKEWLVTAKRQGRKLRREGKDKWVEFTSKVKDKSKKAYKDFKSKMDRKDEELTPGISRIRPTTLPSPTLRTVRPRRPPPPNIQSPLSEDSTDNQLNRRASYEKAMRERIHSGEYGGGGASSLRSSFPASSMPSLQTPSHGQRRSRQYKVLTIDELNGDEGVGAGIAHRRLSQDDEMTYNRVSIDLMNDADIQQVFKKSYSLEDLTCLTSPTIPDIEEAEDALLVGENIDGFHSLVTIPSQSYNNQNLTGDSTSSSTGSSDQSSLSTPTAVTMRRDRVSTPTSGSSDRDSPSTVPRPAPRKRNTLNTGISGTTNPLIKLGAPEQPRSRSSSPANIDTKNAVNTGTGTTSPLSKFEQLEQFDPFSNPSLTDDNNKNVWPDSTDSFKATTGDEAEDNNNDPMLKPRNRNSVYRANAFYNIQRPPSVKHRRISPTPSQQTNNAQAIKDARTAFIQAETTPTPLIPAASVSLTGLDQFDPLLTGQLAVDSPPTQLGGSGGLIGGSRSSGSSVDTGISTGSRTQSAETVATMTSLGSTMMNPEENLLKEWNLDFSKMRIGTAGTVAGTGVAKPAPPPIPPKPVLRGQTSLPTYPTTSPVHQALGASQANRSTTPVQGLVGQGAGTVPAFGVTSTAAGAPPMGFFQQQQQTQQLGSQQSSQFPSSRINLQPSPTFGISSTLQTQQPGSFRSASPVHAFPPQIQAVAPPSGPPMLKPQRPQTSPMDTSGTMAPSSSPSPSVDLLGDFGQLLNPAISQQQNQGMAQQLSQQQASSFPNTSPVQSPIPVPRPRSNIGIPTTTTPTTTKPMPPVPKPRTSWQTFD